MNRLAHTDCCWSSPYEGSDWLLVVPVHLTIFCACCPSHHRTFNNTGHHHQALSARLLEAESSVHHPTSAHYPAATTMAPPDPGIIWGGVVTCDTRFTCDGTEETATRHHATGFSPRSCAWLMLVSRWYHHHMKCPGPPCCLTQLPSRPTPRIRRMGLHWRCLTIRNKRRLQTSDIWADFRQ